jgi:hypothetical protein
MRSGYEQNDLGGGSTLRELELLSEVEKDPQVTQRQLSGRVSIALGLTNIMLRNLAQKGYLRATQSGWKRWCYSLTPEGFSHKIRLTAAYIHRVLDHYQRVRQTLREQLEPLALNVESRIAIYGTGEFAELVYLGIREIGIEEIDVFGTNESHDTKFLGLPVQDVVLLKPDQYDRILIGSLADSGALRAQLAEVGVGSENLVSFFENGRVREEG